MHKLILLLGAFLCATISYAQKTDTLVIFYKTDQYSISKEDKLKLDSFLARDWDRLSINGYTDETDDEAYNLKLSERRSREVFKYFMTKNIEEKKLSTQYFGEGMPQADNGTDDGRALNRRTEIIGIKFPTIGVRRAAPVEDPMKPVTRTLDNGFIITYRPGALPSDMADNFESGSGTNFRLLTNTTQMRQNNLYNNTTNGEILSSVLIICGERLNPCKLDSPIVIKVPIPFKTKCPIQKVKFFNAVAERGRQIWEEENKELSLETVNGMQYIRLLMDDFCQCINFDFKIDPECFDTDSTQLMWVNANIRNLSAELLGLNSVYMPRKINDTTHNILYLKNEIGNARLSFSLYNGKRRIRGFRDKLVTDFPFDESSQKYILSTGKKKFHFSKLDVWGVVLKVNGDKYRVPADDNDFDFIYLKHKADSILVDFTIVESKKRMTTYWNQQLSSLPYDAAKDCYVIDRNFIKLLKAKEKEKEKPKPAIARR